MSFIQYVNGKLGKLKMANAADAASKEYDNPTGRVEDDPGRQEGLQVAADKGSLGQRC